jgi:hypothetical protein
MNTKEFEFIDYSLVDSENKKFIGKGGFASVYIINYRD